MSYWQFKFSKEDAKFPEFKDLQDGDLFFTQITENHILNDIEENSIVFWDRTDKQKGIMLITQIQSKPCEIDIVGISTGKGISMKVIKKLFHPFSLEKNSFKLLHNKLNTTKYKGRVKPRESIDSEVGAKLLDKILGNKKEPKLNLMNINEKKIKKTLKIFSKNYKEYIKDGESGKFYNIFMEANIAKQEVKNSKYLAGLFNKDGNHCHGNLFFSNFINELKGYEEWGQRDVITKFDLENYTVKTEVYDDSKTQKGFMDIVIEDADYMIIIENKTGTKDHGKQLIRYAKYASEKKENKYIILYLTPYGDNPEDEEATNKNTIVSISHIDDIKTSMEHSINSIKNEKLLYIIEKYIESIDLYSDNLPTNWEYELKTMEEIIKREDIFNQCDTLTTLINHNIIDKYNLLNKEDIKIAKWISKHYIKSKALIEKIFLKELCNILDLDSKFTFSDYFSYILKDNNSKSVYLDIRTISDARFNRLSFNPKLKYKDCRICIAYSMDIEENHRLSLVPKLQLCNAYKQDYQNLSTSIKPITPS